jgi:AraC-like DNA-binding protein
MKKRLSQIAIAGFETLPEGHLLNQFVDFTHAIGVGYERCVGYTKDYHTHDRINLAFPRQASVITFLTKGPTNKFVVDDTRFLWMPKDVVHRQETNSAVYDNLAIFPDESSVIKAVGHFEQRYGKTVTPPTESIMARRTPLLDALLSLYFAERIIERRTPKALDGTVSQIFDEMFRILFCPKHREKDREAASFDGSEVSRAIKFIEANLFSEIDSKAIASFARLSVPTLFRKFKDQLGMTPREYIVKRRMDEAMTLLKRGDHSVTDVALLVGYQDIAAFSKRFTRHFKRNPSSLIAHND